jgi:hypothetical protein
MCAAGGHSAARDDGLVAFGAEAGAVRHTAVIAGAPRALGDTDHVPKGPGVSAMSGVAELQAGEGGQGFCAV